MSASIARYLKDFGEPKPVPVMMTPEFDIGGMAEEFDLPVVEEEPAVDSEAERGEAHSECFQAARAGAY